MMPVWAILIFCSACTGVAVAVGRGSFLEAIGRINHAREDSLRDGMERVGLDTSHLGAWMQFRTLAALGGLVVVGIGLGMPPVGVLAGAVIFAAVPAYLGRRIERQKSLIRDQLVTASRALAGQIRGRATLLQGLEAVGREFPVPLGLLFRNCLSQHYSGVPIDVALRNLKDRVQLESLSLFSVALTISFARKEGEALAEVLDRIAFSLAENQRVDRKREIDTAGGRLVVGLLTSFPPAFLALFFILDLEATRLVFASISGQIILCMVGVITWFSRWLSQRIFGRVV